MISETLISPSISMQKKLAERSVQLILWNEVLLLRVKEYGMHFIILSMQINAHSS